MTRARERIADLPGRGLDLVGFWEEATAALAPAVPYYLAPCFYTLDPASLLITSHYQDGLPEIPPEWLADEYYADDFNKIVHVVRSARGVRTLHEATGGRPERSHRYRTAMSEHGAEQEVIVGLRARSGDAWGCLGLYREVGAPTYSPDELELLRDVSGHLAEGARRALLVGGAADPEGPDAPGLVVLREDWSVESATPGAEAWLAELPDGDWEGANRLPPAVLAVAGRARRTADDEAPGEVAFARVLAASGRWVVLHGASLVSDGATRTAVIIEPAQPARIAPLLMAAHGLTEREQEVARLVLQGEFDHGHRDAPVGVAAHRPATPQGHLREDRGAQPPRARRQGVLRPLRAPRARQRAPGDGRAAAEGRARRGPLSAVGPRIPRRPGDALDAHRPPT